MMYRGYNITYDPQPVPCINYTFAHEDYDGPEDVRCGTGATQQHCKGQIEDMIEELEE